tara:strand:+ start:1696 stop:2301 length:606 start_codon:yes stop_codon:yes gene_type:complete
MKGFKRCEKGHMFKDNLSDCPYCPKGSTKSNDKTEVAGDPKLDKTEIFVDSSPKTEQVKQKMPVARNIPKDELQDLNKTFIQGVTEDDSKEESSPRSTRKLMGWIVSFSNDPMGIDYKIYEGRNFLGTSSKLDITIGGDQSISGNHALILCRKQKFWIKDEMSSNGTFLNEEEIEPNESPELKDGDNIKIGSTIFKFKTCS